MSLEPSVLWEVVVGYQSLRLHLGILVRSMVCICFVAMAPELSCAGQRIMHPASLECICLRSLIISQLFVVAMYLKYAP